MSEFRYIYNDNNNIQDIQPGIGITLIAETKSDVLYGIDYNVENNMTSDDFGVYVAKVKMYLKISYYVKR